MGKWESTLEELEMKLFDDTFRARQVLLTGHTGFKGSWLTLWLQELGAKVTGIAFPPESTPNHRIDIRAHNRAAIEDMPADMFPDRPWGKGNNPKTAVREYLARLAAGSGTAADGGSLRFEVDAEIENKLLITVAPEGYLRRV